MKNSTILSCASIWAAALLSLTPAHAQQRYTFTSLVDSTGALKEFDALMPSINNRGEVVFHASFPAGGGQPAGRGIYIADGTGYRGVAVTGSVYNGFFANPAINDNGIVAFQATAPDNAEGIFVGDGKTMANQTVATSKAGKLVQFSPVIRFSDYSLGIDGNATAVYHAEFQTTRALGAFANSTQLYPPTGNAANDLVRISPATNARGDVVLQTGAQLVRTTVAGGASTVIASGAGDSPFSSFDAISINDSGTVAFVATLKSGGTGLFTGDGSSTPTAVVDTTPQSQFSAIRSVSINNSGSIAFGANLRSGGSNLFVTSANGTGAVLESPLFGANVSGFYTQMTPRALNDAGQIVFWYRLADGRQGIAVATPTNGVGAKTLGNISTRLPVQTGESVLIGGFIVTGSQPKRVIIRALGPSLAQAGVTGALADPVLELVGADGTVLAANDNWRESQQGEIEQTGVQPSNDLEAAIVRTLDPGNYTAVLRGKNETTGVGLVEAYDLNQGGGSKLANISTRGFVDTGENVLIGGFIVGPYTRTVVRAIGPSLGNQGVTNALQDPTLELVNGDGTVIAANDNWKDAQRAEIEAIGIQPSDDREAVIIRMLGSGSYTAVVRGVAGTTGVGLVEVYNLE